MNTKALKSKILVLLIKGELTAKWRQEHKDIESSDVLLESIRQEKEKKLNDELIAKKKKPTAKVEIREVSENDKPFEIPPTWKWCRLGDVGFLNRGSGIKRTDVVNNGFPCVRYGELYTTYKTSFKEIVSFIPEKLFNECKKIYPNNILMPLTGENHEEIAQACAYLGTEILAMSGDMTCLSHYCNSMYLVYLINSPYGIETRARISTGDIIVHMSNDRLADLVIPLPPLEEQKEIARIAQSFMTMIDEVESSYSSIEDLSKKAKTKILDLLIKGELTAKWREEHKDIESADVLLESIRQEKEKKLNDELIAKKKKPTAKVEIREVSENDKPFEIPPTWKWCRLGDLYNIRSAMRIHKTDWKESGIPFFRGRDLVKLAKDGDVKPAIYISEQLYQYNKEKGGVPKENDILISAVGTIGKSYIVKGTKPFYYKDAYILCLENWFDVNSILIKVLLDTPFIQNQIHDGAMATTVEQLTIEKAKVLLIPLPPLEEQKEMVRIADKLLSQIDSLVQIDSTPTGENADE